MKAVVASRWPNGFVCPRCAHPHALTTRALFQCAKCRSQTLLIAGTIFQSTTLPLRIGLRAMYHLTQAKNRVSALELSRRLGVSYNIAWKLKQKLMQAMKEREDGRQLGVRN